jgi:hypothetical protein
MFYPAASSSGKSVLVRQLRGPHLSTWPWCSKRSSMALTPAASPSSLPQSSTGRLEVSMATAYVECRSFTVGRAFQSISGCKRISYLNP